MPEEKKSFGTIVKDNLISIILVTLITAFAGLFSATTALTRNNEKRILVLETAQEARELKIVEELQGIAIDLGDMDSTTRSHDRAIARLETLIEVMRAGD